MDVLHVDQYESDSSDEEILQEKDGINVNRKRRTKHWIKDGVFDNATEAEASIINEWSKHYTNYSENGRKVYYRCKKTKFRGPQCSAGLYLL